MNYFKKSTTISSSFNQIKITGIKESVFFLKNQRCGLILNCSAINFTLMNYEQQKIILDLYKDCLNSLDISYQIYIKVRLQNLNDVKDKESFKQTHLPQILKTSQKELMQSLTQNKQVFSRQFYIVLSDYFNKNDYQITIQQIHLKAQMVIQYLQKLGLSLEILNTKSTLKLLQSTLNPFDLKSLKDDDLNILSYESLTEDVNYLKINDTVYTSTLVVKNYPLTADINCLDSLINYEANYDLSFHIQPVDHLYALKQLERKITELESQKRQDLKSGKVLSPQVTDPLDSALDLRAKLLRQQENLFQLSIYITVFAKNKHSLLNLAQKIKNLLASRLFVAQIAKWQQLLAWESSLPLGIDNLLDIKRNFDSSALTLTFPFRSPQILAPNGVLYGLNKINNSLVMIDRFALPNANAVIFAQSGAGKSYTTKVELLRYFLKGIKVIIIDPEGEYQTICNALNGNYISIQKDGKHHLNPFEISFVPTLKNQVLQEKLPALMQIMELMVDGLNARQKAQLDKTLIKLYQAHKKPFLKDLKSLLQQVGEDELCLKLEKFISGSFKEIFAHSTNINLNNPLTVFNIQQVDENLRPLIMMIIAHFVNEQIINQPSPRLLIIDEAWLLMRHKTTKDFLNSLVRRARKYYLGVTLISQQVADFYENKEALALIAQASLKILLRQDSTQIKMVSQQLNLSEYEEKFLLTCHQGEALMIADNQHVLVKILASKREHPLITTDPKEIYKLNQSND